MCVCESLPLLLPISVPVSPSLPLEPTCISHAGGSLPDGDVRVAGWMDAYRDLLDAWQLWSERAQLDVVRLAARVPATTVPPHVFVRCSFCDASVVSATSAHGGATAQRCVNDVN